MISSNGTTAGTPAWKTIRPALAASLVVHVVLAWVLLRVEAPEPKPPPPVFITLPPLPAAVPEPEPEPEPETPETPEPETPEPEREVPPARVPETPSPRRPEPKSEPAPRDADPPPEPVPDFGISMAGGASANGGGLPAGDPDAPPRGSGERKPTVRRRRELTPEPAAQPSVECTEDEVKAEPIEAPHPSYTEAAQAAGIEGKVRLRVTIGADGRPSKVEILSSLDPGLDAAAQEFVLTKWRFEPATRCGKAVPSTRTISLTFRL